MEPHERVYRSKRQIFIHNFIGGIAWGLGATVGLAIFLAVLGFVLRNIDFVPIVGDFVSNIADYVIRNQSLQNF